MKKHLIFWLALAYTLAVWGFIAPWLISAKTDWQVIVGALSAISPIYVIYLCWRLYAQSR